MPLVSGCQAGEVIAIRQADRRSGEAVVKAACQDKTKGQWYCATHREHFPNQFMKDVNISKGKHRLGGYATNMGQSSPEAIG